MGAGMPKQFRSLANRPVLWWSMKAFHDEDTSTRIILVLPKDFITLWKDFFDSLPEEDRFFHEITSGGGSRGESVKNGLKLVDSQSLVAIHDGARPLVTPEMIAKGWETAAKFEAAIPVVPVTDSLREITKVPEESRSVDRSRFVAVQTPQVFDSEKLKQAYRLAGEKSFTDDAAVMEAAGYDIRLFPGNHRNIKITNPEDLAIAELIMQKDG